MMGNYHVPCGAGEKLEITSNAYLLPTFQEGVLLKNRQTLLHKRLPLFQPIL